MALLQLSAVHLVLQVAGSQPAYQQAVAVVAEVVVVGPVVEQLAVEFVVAVAVA